MRKLDSFKKKIKNIPEFSDQNYTIVGYIFAALITLAGGYLIYKVLTTDALTFNANWNMFKSPFGNLCFGIGIICAIIFWGKFGHWSRTPVLVTKDAFGNVEKVERNWDFIEVVFWTILFPFIGHFIIEPIIYGALIYYPIQCIIAVVGTIFPYILSLIVLAVIAGSWMFTRTFQFRYHSAVLVFAGLLFTIAFSWSGYIIGKSEPGMTNGTPSSTEVTAGDDTDGTGGDSDYSNSGVIEETDDDQFESVGEEGLYGCLPEGTTEFAGDMEGYSIEFSITKSSDMGEITAIFKNVEYGTTMQLTGESLPADGGNINFYGKDGDNDWIFVLSGDCDEVTGTAKSGDSELNIVLHKK